MRGMAFACWPGPVVPACLRIVRPHGRGRRISPSGAIGGTVTGHGGASTRRTVAARRIRWTRKARVHGKGIRPKADAGAGSQEGGVSRGAAPQRARLQGYGSQQGVRPQGRHLPPGIKARLRRLRAGYRVRRGVGVLESARYSVHDKQDLCLISASRGPPGRQASPKRQGRDQGGDDFDNKDGFHTASFLEGGARCTRLSAKKVNHIKQICQKKKVYRA